MTFSTTMMASSTTRPIASTNASSVSRLIEKPNTSMKVKVPTSESGIATTGINTERGEPRKTNTTSVTISTAITSVRTTSWMALLTKSVEVVDDLAVQALGEGAWMPGKIARTPWITSSRLAAGATWIPI